jgi:hypothetical protein
MPRNIIGHETGLTQSACHARSVRPDVSRRIFVQSLPALQQDVFSFYVGCFGCKQPTVQHLTESWAQPPTADALLLLALPLLLTLQKLAAEPE